MSEPVKYRYDVTVALNAVAHNAEGYACDVECLETKVLYSGFDKQAAEAVFTLGGLDVLYEKN